MPTRLGLDIGTNSIGWWLYETRDGSPIRSIDGGVRIFSDGRHPKSKESLAKDRRAARAMRRRRDRYLRRRASLMRKLAASGLMPTSPQEAKVLESLDPFELRARGLIETLTLHELGRALFHLNQRRGFKSNRKTDRGDNEGGKIKDAAARLDQAMMEAGAPTLGAFLHARRAASPDRPPAVRTRLRTLGITERGTPETGYDFYPERRHLEDEFHQLWVAQAPHHPALTDTLRAELWETIFHQRPLKAPAVGRCLFFEDRRLAKAHPLHQRSVVLQAVNALQIIDGAEKRSLLEDERRRVLLALNKEAKAPKSADVTFDRLRRTLRLPAGATFSHEKQTRGGVQGDVVRSVMAHASRFGPSWMALSPERQWRIIARIRHVETEEQADRLIARLMREHGLAEDNAREVLAAPLPDGHGRIGLKATRLLLPHLERGLIYSMACEAAGLHHSDHRTGEALDRLPYYGRILDRHVIPGSNDPTEKDEPTRFGRITNPTVHIGLGQLRRVVNAIIDRHGVPDRIVVELGRDLKLSQDQKRELEVVNKRNRDAALRRGDILVKELEKADTGANRLILKLWEEQGADPLHRFCPYSGRPITAMMLFNGEVEVDHILPFSRTLDDSNSNKVLCLREANRRKRNRTPWEAFSPDPALWETLEPLIARLPAAKRWRFGRDAMQRFEGERGFLARQLTDTQYLSRIAREYLSRLYPERGEAPVYVVPGRMTEMLRRQWGLNFDLSVSESGPAKEKDRSDHRHHAIDAAVIGATDQGLMARIQQAAGRRRENGTIDVVADLAPPYDGFRDELRNVVDRIVVSHRPDHGRIAFEGRKKGRDSTAGALHNDTAYGLTGKRDKRGVPIVVVRKPLDSVRPEDIPMIAELDPCLAAELESVTRGLSGKALQAALAKFSAQSTHYRGIRRVRLQTKVGVIPITDASGRSFKGMKGDSNHVYEIWRMPDGSWERVVVSTFNAHQPGFDSHPHPAAKKLMRIHKRDLVRIRHPKSGELLTATVVKFGEPRLDLAPHNETNPDGRMRDKDDPFDMIRMSLSTFRRCGGRLIHVDALGRVRDPGPFDAVT